MKHISAGVDDDICYQSYKNKHFKGRKWLNMPSTVSNNPKPCRANTDSQPFGTSSRHEMYIN